MKKKTTHLIGGAVAVAGAAATYASYKWLDSLMNPTLKPYQSPITKYYGYWTNRDKVFLALTFSSTALIMGLLMVAGAFDSD